MSEPLQTPDVAAAAQAVSATETRAKRSLIIGLVVVGLVMVGMIALLVILSVNAYNTALAGTQPDPGAVVVSLLRDAAIILVAFETMIIGLLMVVLTLQIQALIALLRDEIKPMLEAVNETLATVRGTAQFVSHQVVSPTIRAASVVAGAQRVVRELVDLVRPPKD